MDFRPFGFIIRWTDAGSETRYFGCIWIHQMVRCDIWLNKKWISKSNSLIKGYSRNKYEWTDLEGPFLLSYMVSTDCLHRVLVTAQTARPHSIKNGKEQPLS